MRSSRRDSWRTVATLLLASALALHGATVLAQDSDSHPRERLYGEGAGEILTDLMQNGPRWVVLFAPRVEACTPQEVAVAAALERLQSDFPELVVRTLLPESLPEMQVERGIFGHPYPGTLIRVATGNWERENRVAPRPRLEVWSGKGELLLMRSLPSNVSENAIYDEVLWARAFTDPPDDPRRRP